MDLQRLRIVRHDKTILAADDSTQQYLEIVNPGHIPEGVQDGIFSVDYQNKTAQFESRKAEPKYVLVTRKEFKDTPKPRAVTLPDGTVNVALLDGAVNVTRKNGTVYVDAEGLSKDAQRLLAGLVLEAYVLTDGRIANALRYALDK